MTYPPQPGYPPQGQPGYPPAQPGYPPAGPVPGYPPAAPQPGYPQPQPAYAPPQPAPQQAPAAPQVSLSDWRNAPAGSGKSIAGWFKTPGQALAGRVPRAITDADARIQTNMVTQKVDEQSYYSDGRPKVTLTVPLELLQPWPPEFPDGRAAYVMSASDRDELARAMAEAGVTTPDGLPEAGCHLVITFTHFQQTNFPQPKKVKQIKYIPPGIDPGPYLPQSQPQPAPGYAQPQPGYAPQPQYAQPQPGYAPQPQYAQPAQGNGQATVPYAPPAPPAAPQYAQPAPQQAAPQYAQPAPQQAAPEPAPMATAPPAPQPAPYPPAAQPAPAPAPAAYPPAAQPAAPAPGTGYPAQPGGGPQPPSPENQALISQVLGAAAPPQAG